jgi:hypothetical protein
MNYTCMYVYIKHYVINMQDFLLGWHVNTSEFQLKLNVIFLVLNCTYCEPIFLCVPCVQFCA